MKEKFSFLTISLAVVLAILLFIPLPLLLFKILYFADFLLGISIFVMTVITVIRKKTVKFIPYFLLYFSIFTIALNINSARNILIFAKGKIGELPVIPKVIGELFSFGFVKGM